MFSAVITREHREDYEKVICFVLVVGFSRGDSVGGLPESTNYTDHKQRSRTFSSGLGNDYKF